MRFRRLGTISAVLIAAAILFTQVLVAPAGAADATASGPPFTIVAVPDTQFYTTSDTAAATFAAQTQWIVDNMAAKNIAFVTHLGDITENGNRIGYEAEWPRADAAMDTLDTVNLPYGLVAGNHDVLPIPPAASTMYEMYFGADRFTGDPWYGGHYGSTNLNSYQLFSAGGMDLIVLNLEFSPTQSIVDWANGILRSHQDRWAIVVTHYYLSQQSSGPGIRFTNNLWYSGKTPEQLWNELIYPNCNVVMVLSGHDPGEDRREDLNACGGQVHQLLQDYQGRPNGGNGWLRYFEFDPAQNQIRAFTYSPTLGQFEIDADSQFILPLGAGSPPPPPPPPPPSNTIFSGSVDATSATAPRWTSTTYTPSVNGQHTLTLDWTGSADLRIEVRVASTNAWVGANTSTTRPKSLTVNLSAGTAYKVAVWSVSGSAAFTVRSGSATPVDQLPTVGLTAPAAGATVAGTVTITASASDDVGVGSVAFTVDGTVVGTDTDGANGWSAPWDTATAPDGTHVLGATATDTSGQTGAAPARTVTVANSGPAIVFSSTVDASGSTATRWKATTFTPTATGSHTFVLDWSGSANLRFDVRVAATNVVVKASKSTAHPKSLTVNLTAGTAYQIAVWSMSGAASFTVTATSPG